MIPKTIHYCWFGHNPKPKLFYKCYKSWRKYCHDYAIIEWNEDNYDLASAPLYVRQAYAEQKWAFVSDYVRLDVIFKNGGVYLDTDVELIGALDGFLSDGAFFGFERAEYVNTGLGFGAEKGAEILLEMMNEYGDSPFIQADGSYDLTTCPVRNTNVLLRHGFKQDGSEQILEETIHIYPKEVFCPWNESIAALEKTKKTATIHWYAGSWLSEELRKEVDEYRDTMRRNRLKESIRQTVGEKGYLFAQKFWRTIKGQK